MSKRNDDSNLSSLTGLLKVRRRKSPGEADAIFKHGAALNLARHFVSEKFALKLYEYSTLEGDGYRQRIAHVWTIAQFLFYFRYHPDFKTITKKYKNDDLDDMHAELHVAYLFSVRGYSVKFVREQKGRKTHDLEVRFGDEFWKLEISRIRNAPITENNLRGKLEEKSQKFDDNDKYAIIVIVPPTDWIRDDKQFFMWVDVTRGFLNKTSKVSAVLYLTPHYMQLNEIDLEIIPQQGYTTVPIGPSENENALMNEQISNGPKMVSQNGNKIEIENRGLDIVPRHLDFHRWVSRIIASEKSV